MGKPPLLLRQKEEYGSGNIIVNLKLPGTENIKKVKNDNDSDTFIFISLYHRLTHFIPLFSLVSICSSIAL